MKKLLLLALLAIAGVFITGRVMLGEAGAMRFLMQMEKLANEGKADEICAMIHEDLHYSIVDGTAVVRQERQGGKAGFCELTRESVKLMSQVQQDSSAQVDVTTVQQQWLHPWTSEVSYTENRSMTLRDAGITISTVSADDMTLVLTFSGVKMLKLRAEVGLAD